MKISLLAVLCICSFVFHIWFRTAALTSGYSVGKLRKEISKLESQIADAQVERNRMMSSSRLETWVDHYRDRGITLHAPRANQIFYLAKPSVSDALSDR